MDRKSGGSHSLGLVADLSQGRLVFVAGQLRSVPETGEKIISCIQDAKRQAVDYSADSSVCSTNMENVLWVDGFSKDTKDAPGMNEEYAKHFPVGSFLYGRLRSQIFLYSWKFPVFHSFIYLS